MLAMNTRGFAGEEGKAVDEFGGEDLDVDGPAVVEEVPDDLDVLLAGGVQHGRPGGPVEGAGAIDEMPAETVAGGGDVDVVEAAGVGEGVEVVLEGGGHVEADAVGIDLGGALEAGHPEGVEEVRHRSLPSPAETRRRR